MAKIRRSVNHPLIYTCLKIDLVKPLCIYFCPVLLYWNTMERDISHEQLQKYLLDTTVFVDANTFIKEDFSPVEGSLNFLGSMITMSGGKVHILTEGFGLREVKKFIKRWHISSNPFFMEEQVWEGRKPAVEIVAEFCSGLDKPSTYITESVANAQSLLNEAGISTGIVLLESGPKGQLGENRRLFKFDKEDPNFNLYQIFGLFYDPTFWQRLKG